MYFYQVKLVIKDNNLDECIDCFDSLSAEFEKEKGGLDYSFCQDTGKLNTYILAEKQKSNQDLEKHFKCDKLPVLIGATRLLGESMDFNIGKSEDQEKIAFQPNELGD